MRSPRRDLDQLVERGLGAAVVDDRGRPARRPRAGSRPSRRPGRRRRRSAARCRGRRPARPAAGARSASAFSAGVPPVRSASAARCRPTASGVTVNSRTWPSRHSATLVSPVVVISSMPPPWTTQARSEPSAPSTWASGATQRSAKTPTTWRLAPAGLVSGPSRLKMVRKPSSARIGDDVAHGAVVGRGEQEADAGLVQRLQLALGPGVDGRRPARTARRRRRTWTTAPGCRAWRPSGPPPAATKRHGGGDVERVQAVAAGAADVDGRVGRLERGSRPGAWPARRR